MSSLPTPARPTARSPRPGPCRPVAWARAAAWRRKARWGYFTLVDDNGWTYAQAERWLVRQATAALGDSW
jgi:hypothetical protein